MSFNPHGSSAEVPVGVIIDKSTRVFIKDIPVSRFERDGFEAMKAEFLEVGPIELYVLHKDASGRFTGTAMCTYRNPADAKVAIRKLNNSDVDGVEIKVSLAKEHGVILANQMQRYDRRQETEEARWTHDKYELMRLTADEPERHFRGRGGRGGGRGFSARGGRGSHRGGARGRGGSFIDDSFEQYIAKRDAARQASATGAEVSGALSTNEGAAATPEVVSTSNINGSNDTAE